MNQVVSIVFFFAGCGVYAYELAGRAAEKTAFTASLADPRMDVVAIAVLGILAHFAFAPRAPAPAAT